MRGRGASDVSVDAALDALEGLVRAACDGGDGPSLAASSAAIGDVVLGLLGEDDRTPMHPLPVEPSLTRRVDPAFEALMAGDDGAVARFDALIAAATLRGDGRALWRAFVCLHVVRRRATTIPAYDELLAAVLAGLGTARHFGLPVPEIAAGTADRRWTPPSDAVLILQYLGAHPGTTSRDVGLALGLDRDPRRLRRLLDELVSRGLITSTKSGRALAWNAADSSRFSP
jgi:hypothetical protein